MEWIKKNLVLVISGVVALVLLGLAGTFLYTRLQHSGEVANTLTEQDQEVQRLLRLKPHPGNRKVDNITLAKEQEQKVLDFAGRARASFAPIVAPTNLDSGQFRLLLVDTLDTLTRRAAASGVKLPENFAFTFTSQKSQSYIDQASVAPLSRSLLEVKEICQTLFDAKILQIDRIRRVGVDAKDAPGIGAMGGASDYWTRKPTTNDLAVLMPYEFTIRCFSGELQHVLQGLARSPHNLLVKNLVVDTGETNQVDDVYSASPAEGGGESGAAMGAAQMRMMMMMRYGRGRYMPTMPTEPDPSTQPTSDASIIVREKPFRVTAWIDVVRLRDPNEAKGGGPARGGRTAPGSDDGGATATTDETAGAEPSGN